MAIVLTKEGAERMGWGWSPKTSAPSQLAGVLKAACIEPQVAACIGIDTPCPSENLGGMVWFEHGIKIPLDAIPTGGLAEFVIPIVSLDEAAEEALRLSVSKREEARTLSIEEQSPFLFA